MPPTQSVLITLQVLARLLAYLHFRGGAAVILLDYCAFNISIILSRFNTSTWFVFIALRISEKPVEFVLNLQERSNTTINFKSN